MSELLEKLKTVAEGAVGREVLHLETLTVRETFQGKMVWEGVVDVFTVKGSRPRVRVYAWAVESDAGTQYVAVLGQPPADSPLAAVRVWRVSQPKK
jgi:hypothetical protein